MKAYLENEKRIKKFLTRFLHNPQDVDEIAQEAFLRAFAAEGKQSIKLPRSFLYRTAKNLALDHNRRKSTILEGPIEDQTLSSVIPDEEQASPEDQLSSKEMLMEFARAVSALPERSRRVFILAKVHGATYKEIAAELGITVSTVEKHVAAAIVKCNRRLVEQGYAPETFGGRNLVGPSKPSESEGNKRRDGE